MDPLLICALIAAVAAIVAAAASIAALVCARREATRSGELAQQVFDIQEGLEDEKRSLAALVQHTASSSPLIQQRLEILTRQLEHTGDKMDALRTETARELHVNRENVEQRLDRVSETTRAQLSEMRAVVDRQFTNIRTDTNTQLERMRSTVDEKLQETLDVRIRQSFELVNKQLGAVSRGLGEMQSLAADVGGLKRVLSNVKTRGIMGEVQLGAILREILSPGQYAENVATVPDSAARVEFAVKLPGADGETTWLPIDSKFPGDAYEHLRAAEETGDAAAIDAAWKALENRIKQEAKDIRDKYLEPPATTTFGILFLPFEGLYAEVVDRPGLLEELQHTYHVNIAGPSTMAALLNSLQMGFQTVAIQKRAAEIQQVLAAVKTEFGRYHESLLRAKKQLNTVGKTVDELLGARANKMNRALDGIVALESLDAADRLLGIEPDVTVGESHEAVADAGTALDEAVTGPQNTAPFSGKE